MPIIPRIIHFIWAGGEKIMPGKAILNVTKWAEANPEFTIKIWVDPVTDPNYLVKYQKAFNHDIPQNIIFSDINQNGICTDAIRYELDGLWPNYGASSDMLRYKILYLEGGAYFDCGDVCPNKSNKLASIVFPDSDISDAGKKVFNVEMTCRKLLFHITPHSALPGENPGTEAIICTPLNEEMKLFADMAQSSYQDSKWLYKNISYTYQPVLEKSQMVRRTHSADDRQVPLLLQKESPVFRRVQKVNSSNTTVVADQNSIAKIRAKNTLDLTGPGLIPKLLKINNQYLMPHDPDGKTDWVTLPTEHSLSWVPMHIVPHDYKDAMRTAIDSLYFEASNMRILNLSSHVEQITCSIMHEKMEPKDIELLKIKIKSDLVSNLKNDNRFESLIGVDKNDELYLKKFELKIQHK